MSRFGSHSIKTEAFSLYLLITSQKTRPKKKKKKGARAGGGGARGAGGRGQKVDPVGRVTRQKDTHNSIIFLLDTVLSSCLGTALASSRRQQPPVARRKLRVGGWRWQCLDGELALPLIDRLIRG